MTDRLRKLDALFAKRVLGCKVQANSRCGCVDKRHCPGERIGDGNDLLHYTRSIDAAWEATNDKEFCCREIFSDYNFVHRARVETEESHANEEPFTAQSQDHPAEALVLACLRAVGVSEEELA